MRAYRLLKKLMPSSGGGDDFEKAKKSIRLARYGCANRPFYHIVVVLVSIRFCTPYILLTILKYFWRSNDVIVKPIQLNSSEHMILWKIIMEKN